ncbi:hypothetical protein BD560DRAFT_400810 [Blakeslea trispora]|nr:hypothetical protein BD560DRAFT_400810 [Blakeslea trispora]
MASSVLCTNFDATHLMTEILVVEISHAACNHSSWGVYCCDASFIVGIVCRSNTIGIAAYLQEKQHLIFAHH